MGGGGDGGAAAAQQQEEQRQARIKAAVDTINAVFDGKKGQRGVNAATAFDPNATYYDASGNAVAIPTAKAWTGAADENGQPVSRYDPNSGFSLGIDQSQFKDAPDVNWFNQQAKGGKLFTGTEQYGADGNRNALYDEQKQAVTDLNTRDVEKQFAEAERQNRFGLARNGLLGGSADIDSNAQLQDKTNEGLVKAAALGDQAAADLKTADERTRQSLISMAQSGIDTGTAQQMALRNLDANAQTAAGDKGGATIGNLFGDLSQAYLMNKVASGQTAGLASWQQKYPNLSTSNSYQGSVNGG